ncbi:MAG: GntR family transcriptional regulator [Anaerolineae bacterium]|nr:GntR family transcriptional regulator [Anaerolineae bacterium]
MENKVDLQPVSLPSLDDVVYQLLRERILRYDFAPGTRLDLSELESSLAVSRTPLKNALTRLEAEGLVDIQARRGTFVVPVNGEKLDEAYKIRSAFELYVALCLFKYLTPEDYAFFQNIRGAMDELAQTGDWQTVIHDYLQLDQQFHQRLVERGGTPRMVQLFQQMNVHMQVARIVRYFHPRDFEAIHFEHEQIFEALGDPSSQRLSAALLNHLEASRMRALKYSQETP